MIQKRLLINDDKAPTTWKMPEQRFCGASRTIRCEYEPIALGYYQTTHVPYIRREFIKLCNDAGRMHDDPSHTSLHHLPNKSHESYSI